MAAARPIKVNGGRRRRCRRQGMVHQLVHITTNAPRVRRAISNVRFRTNAGLVDGRLDSQLTGESG